MVLTRVAVGDHILLGGDNMDLALAHAMVQKFAERKIKLDQGQMLMLWHSCRAAKERLFAEPGLTSTPVTVLGRGSKVIGGTIKGELSPGEVERLLIDGFFPRVPVGRSADPAAGGRPAGAGPALRQRPGGDPAPGLLPDPAGGQSQGTPPAPSGGPVQRRRLQGRAVAAPRRVDPEPVGRGRAAASRCCTTRTWTAPWPAARPTMAWCAAARACASAAARPGPTTSASRPPCPRCRGPAAGQGPVRGALRHGGRHARAKSPARSSASSWASRPSSASWARPSRRTDTVGTLVEEWDDEIEELSPLTTTLEAPDKAGQSGAGAPAKQGNRDRHPGAVVPEPRQQAALEAGVQRARAGVSGDPSSP